MSLIAHELNYKEASWLGVNKIIKDHSEYALIVKHAYNRLSNHYEENKEFIEEIISICASTGRKCKVVTDDEIIKYEDIYKYFLE
jgi:RNA processing factor Prp31